MYSKKLGVSGTYWAVISNIIGAAAQTSANWRQSKVAPIAKDANKPICDDILLAWNLQMLMICKISEWKFLKEKRKFVFKYT